ncbi:NADAR family protein [Streptomyces sp. TRM 70361]|uniref:NADAR family protein n=1 Tax=Streptomyces sp. TRM 70361 TaxID=3116553 RepID=UPI002E7BFE9A|nr:NADAR family protein [Streptomyces sp. TRM 70361]MEE1942741.1 NADAR family protein [Streptomyces sp. TRM 70361]
MTGTAPGHRVAELVARRARGEPLKYLYFRGNSPRRGGPVGPECLSQWWPAPFTAAGVGYATAEHWMMAAKARLFGDAEAEERVLAAAEPGAAKAAGRTVRGFHEEVWAEHRFGIVVEGNVHKFGRHADLRAFLLATGGTSRTGGRRGGRVLVEASPLDRIWGIGLAADDGRAADPARWRGLNLLGFALMAARERLAAG